MVSYIWRHLEVGYVQGMCDLLAPLLVILDDGESTVSSQCQCVYTWLVTQPFALTQHLRLSLLPPPTRCCHGAPRGNGLQLLHPAHEEDEPQLPTRRRHGHTFRQHALPHPGEERCSPLCAGCRLRAVSLWCWAVCG